MAEPLTARQTVLAVFPAGEDRIALDKIFAGSDWSLHQTRTLVEARKALDVSPIDAVLSDRRFPDGQSWQDLLCILQHKLNPPPLIVADRLADERLWAEVLNLGGDDLLLKPFHASEVLYAVGSACRRSQNQKQAIAPRKVSATPERSALSAARARAGSSGR